MNNGTIDEDIIEKIVKSIPYWRGVKEAFLKARENNPKESSLDCMIAGNACIKYITDYNVVNMFQWKLTRAGQMQEQQRMFEKQNQFNHMPQPSSNAKTIHRSSAQTTIT